MELRVASVLLLVCVTFIVLTAVQGQIIPSCCLRASKTISKKTLRTTSKYYVQSRAGRCEINALVLYTTDKKFCLDPKLQWLLRKRNIPLIKPN